MSVVPQSNNECGPSKYQVSSAKRALQNRVLCLKLLPNPGISGFLSVKCMVQGGNDERAPSKYQVSFARAFHKKRTSQKRLSNTVTLFSNRALQNRSLFLKVT